MSKRVVECPEAEGVVDETVAALKGLLYVRHDAGLSQADVAARMGTHASAVARLEQSLVTGKHSPSVATLHRYVQACGKRLEITAI